MKMIESHTDYGRHRFLRNDVEDAAANPDTLAEGAKELTAEEEVLHRLLSDSKYRLSTLSIQEIGALSLLTKPDSKQREVKAKYAGAVESLRRKISLEAKHLEFGV